MNNLKNLRCELGLTQPQVSAWLRSVDDRYDVSMVSRLENDVCLPTPKVLAALCEVLQAPKEALYGASEIQAVNFTADKVARVMSFPAAVQRVVNSLPKGRENAISRKYLKSLSGVHTDRMLRVYIEYARTHKILICNEQRGDGYYIADRRDIEDIKRQYWQGKHRVQSIINTIDPFREILIEAGEEV